MSRERSRIVEGTWRCTSCETTGILARHPRCPHCNSPRERAGRESEFDFGPRTEAGGLVGESVTDDEVLGRATAGPDWYCSFCDTANAADLTSCRHCGAKDTERSGTAEVEPLSTPCAPPPPAPAAPRPKQRRPLKLLAGAGLMLLATCGTCAYLGSRTERITAQRSGAAWERTVHRERFTAVVQRGWRDRLHRKDAVMPVDGSGEVAGVQNVRDCQRKERGSRRVVDGTRRVCETRTRRVQCGTRERCEVVNLGNGFARETCRDVPKYCAEEYESCSERAQYRTEPVFALECAYDTHAWKRVETASAQGSAGAPAWPPLAAGPNDRLVREERYRVEYQYLDQGSPRTYVHQPGREADFLALLDHPTVILEKHAFGRVELLEPTAGRTTP